jgi:hypothetical protein
VKEAPWMETAVSRQLFTTRFPSQLTTTISGVSFTANRCSFIVGVFRIPCSVPRIPYPVFRIPCSVPRRRLPEAASCGKRITDYGLRITDYEHKCTATELGIANRPLIIRSLRHNQMRDAVVNFSRRLGPRRARDNPARKNSELSCSWRAQKRPVPGS